MKKLIIAITIFLNITDALISQNDHAPELVTDRPDQTESAFTVPKGYLQIETGIVNETDESIGIKEKTTAWNTTLFRYGLLDNWEIRFGVEYLDYTITDKIMITENQFSGFSPIIIGTKILIANENGFIPQLAFLGHLTISGTGEGNFFSEYLASDFRFALEYSITNNISFGANAGSEWDGVNLNSNNFYSIVLGISPLKNLGIFIEAYGYILEKSSPDHRADVGITYLIKNNLQFDVSTGIGINEIAPDRFLSAGLSWRIPY
ncbi:transporter [candidate division KSB1 bacterium]